VKRGQKSQFDSLKKLLPYQATPKHILELSLDKEEPKNLKDIAAGLLKEINNIEKQFRSGLTAPQKKKFDRDILPILKNKAEKHRPERFPVEYLQRYILTRVLQLGWKEELHGKMDHNMNRPSYSRSPNKPERIGKKYQWIAYHEALAILSDNHPFAEEYYNDNKPQPYEGPWQLTMRDIDPSCILEGCADDKISDETLKVALPEYTSWRLGDLTNHQWINLTDDLPTVESMVRVSDPSGKRSWINLESAFTWDQPVPADEERFEFDRRGIWVHINSIFVKRSEKVKVLEWLGMQTEKPHEMNSVPDPGCFLGERYWARNYSRNGWVSDYQNKNGFKLLVPTEKYFNESGNYDCSQTNSVNLKCPSFELAYFLQISSPGFNGRYVNNKDETIFFDADVNNEDSVALINPAALKQFLDKKKLDIIWVIDAEKRVLTAGHSNNNWPGRLEIFGFAYMDGDQIEGKLKTKFLPPHNKK